MIFRDLVRTAAHFLAITLGFLAWCADAWLFAISTAFAIAADKINPNATTGNCWSHVLPKWWEHGGYMLIRAADGVKFLGFFPIPHVIWVRTLGPETELEQFKPVARKSARWMPWHTVYYKGIRSTKERPHPSH